MIEIRDEMLLYHASYTEIKEIDLAKGRAGLDFGKGFYVTSSYGQARNYIQQALRKARRVNDIPKDFPDAEGIINVYQVRLDADLMIHCFEEANLQWLHFVATNRERSLFPRLLDKYSVVDIIGGKVADDNTARTLALYTEGVYGVPGEKSTDEYTLKLLLPNRLQDQFCFRTQEAINCLEFLRGEKYGDSI
ncbi:MAG: DUF3990 domain-containing protein [Clostridiales bacterium]|nr:DUF3990 domain-containing protein [Clostridiales bacterium]